MTGSSIGLRRFRRGFVSLAFVLVRVGDTDILVGVAPGAVHTLHVFPAGANTAAPPAEPAKNPLPNFKDLLMRSLGR